MLLYALMFTGGFEYLIVCRRISLLVSWLPTK